MKSLVCSILASTLLFGCMSSEDEVPLGTTEQSVSSYVAAVAAATTTFTSAVATNTRNNAAAVGLSVTNVKTGYSARNTIGAAAGTSTVFFVTKPFDVGAGTYQPGLYQFGSTSRGPTLYYFSPTGRVELGLQGPGTPPSTSVGGDLCGGSGVAYSFCTSFVACALYDQGCPQLPCCTWVG
ncbi:MAG: hypothetical protein ABI678_32760 [Kofleriaceae bacterium]